MQLERWARVKGALKQLGVPDRKIGRVGEARDYLDEMSSLGAILLPDFTLHNCTHSDNIVLLLAQLQEKFNLELNAYEAYLLATSAYLHDLGMFFSGDRFQQEILPDLGVLPTCPENCCDRIEDYRLEGKTIGEQIRETHNLLSAYMLQKDLIGDGVIVRDDLPYLMAICRGHRKANLGEVGCACYRDEHLTLNEIRIGLLAALLRLVDALDFDRDRAPRQVFNQRAREFLRNPRDLEHWLKHYFATVSQVERQEVGGNVTLGCTVHFRVPAKRINGESYLDFFRALFEEHVEVLNEKDLNIARYPPVFREALGVAEMRAAAEEDIRRGFRDLPERVIDEIERSECRNILEFLQWLQGIDSLTFRSTPITSSGTMDRNPFYRLRAVVEVEHFYGRGSEVQKTLELLCKSENVEVTGPRRIGKTSFLHYLSHPVVQREHGMDSRHNVFVYIDCQRRWMQQEKQQVYKKMLECVLDAARRAGMDPVPAPGDGFEAATAFEEVLWEMSREGLRIILLLDEFEEMARNSNLDVIFFNNLRALCGADDISIAYVTASCTGLVDLGEELELSSPFFNIFRPLRLRLFSEQVSRQLVEESLRRVGGRFPADLLESVLELGGGYPFFLQMAGYHAFDLLGSSKEWTKGWERVLRETVKEEASRHFRSCWRKLDERAQRVLTNLPSLWQDLGYRAEIEHLAHQCLIVNHDGRYDYFSPLFKDFVDRWRVPLGIGSRKV